MIGDLEPSPSRRRLLATLGVTVGAAGSFASAGAAGGGVAATGSWPQFQYDDANTGHASRNSGPTAAVGTRLSVDVGRGAGTAPAVDGDLAYVTDDAETLYAIDRNDGSTRWSVTAKFSSSWPSVYGDTVYLPGDSVTALDAASGEERWSTQISDTAHGVVRVGDTALAVGRAGITAINDESGNVRWNNDSVSTWREPPAVVGDDVFAVDSSAGTLVSVDAGAGGRQWIRHFDGPAPGAPTVADKLVIVAGSESVHAYNRNTGVQQWEAPVGLEATVAVANGRAYGVTGDELVALSLDGTVEWRTPIPETTNPPVLARSTVYLAGDEGDVAAVDADDGTVRWQSSVGAELRSAFAVAGGELYATTRDGSLAVLATGAGTATPTESSPDEEGDDTDEPPEEGTDAPTATATDEEDESADSGLFAMLGSAGVLTALLARGRDAAGGDGDD